MAACKACWKMGAAQELAAPTSKTLAKGSFMQQSDAILLPCGDEAAPIARTIARFGSVLDCAPFTGPFSVNYRQEL